MTSQNGFKWPIPIPAATAAQQRHEEHTITPSSICAFRDQLQQHDTGAADQERLVRSLFDGQLNIVLPRPQLPRSHPDERRYERLPVKDRDCRTPLSAYDSLDEQDESLLRDLRHVLELSSAFKHEPHSTRCAHSRRDGGSFTFGDKSGLPTADVAHVSSSGVVCKKIVVTPENGGKLFLCRKEFCSICNAHRTTPHHKSMPSAATESAAGKEQHETHFREAPPRSSHEDASNASLPDSPPITITSAQSSKSKDFPTLGEISAAIPEHGIGFADLLKVFSHRVLGREREFFSLAKQVGRSYKSRMVMMPRIVGGLRRQR